MKFEKLRKKYPKFIYKDFSVKQEEQDLLLFFNFKIPPDITFNPKLTIPNGANFNSDQIEDLVFNLGLVEMISYWKTTCSPLIKIKAGKLNREQIKWWENLILKGLGEFFYKNRIDFNQKDFLRIESKGKKYKKNNRKLNGKRILVPIGGGKDSIVTLEQMRKTNKDLVCFALNPNQNIKKVISKAGTKALFVKREINPKLIELNKKGFLNGHTPFSAYLAFLTSLVCTIFDIKYAAFSNERSANFGNTKYLGEEINHQYSKSYEFEKKFRNYNKKYLNQNFQYFSYLRPLNELQIGRRFSNFDEYFDSFISCNEAFKDNSLTGGEWCGSCSKCLFTYLMLFPFLEKEEIEKIFKKDLFKDEDLIPLLDSMVNEKKVKPFECIGTKKEVKAALSLAIDKYENDLPVLLSRFKDEASAKEAEALLHDWNENNFIPENLAFRSIY